MRYNITCDCCGQTVTAYAQKLNEGLIKSFIYLVERYKGKRIKIADLPLTKIQYATFQKLQYWGIVHRNADGYLPTELGLKFAKGEIQLWDTVANMGKRILPRDHEARGTHKQPCKLVYIHDIIGVGYMKREEYQEQRVAGNRLFTP